MIFLIFWFSLNLSQADEVTTKLLRAKTLKHLTQTTLWMDQAEKNASDCEGELTRREFPLACYRQINSEIKLGTLSEDEKNKKWKKLDELCHKASRAGQLTDIENLKDLSPVCQQDLRLALCQRNYRLNLVDLRHLDCLDR